MAGRLFAAGPDGAAALASLFAFWRIDPEQPHWAVANDEGIAVYDFGGTVGLLARAGAGSAPSSSAMAIRMGHSPRMIICGKFDGEPANPRKFGRSPMEVNPCAV